MKTFRNFVKESNVSAGIGVRGFGDVSGTPATTEDSDNSHIQRVIQGAEEYKNSVKEYIDGHNTTHVLDEPDDNWWAKAGAKGSSLTALGTSKGKNRLSEEMNTGGVAGLGDTGHPVPEGKTANWSEPPVSAAARKRHKKNNQEQGDRRTFIIGMLRRAFPNMVGTK